MSKYLLLVITLPFLCNFFQLAEGLQSDIEDIRLVDTDGSIGGFKGRVEVLHNGVWGTICSNGWYNDEAEVACRMLGFDDVHCPIRNYGYQFGSGNNSSPIWMDKVRCRGNEVALDFCSFEGWEVHSCDHYQDAGAVCLDDSSVEIGVPYNISLIASTTTSLTFGWTVPTVQVMDDTFARMRFNIKYKPSESISSSYSQTTVTSSSASTLPGDRLSHTLGNLKRDTDYSILIRTGARSTHCSYYSGYIYGNFSDPVFFQTNATRQKSNISVRLVTPATYAGFDFLGRVEVYHNNEWGTVCDDYFYTDEANVICGMLNFTEGALCRVSSSRLGAGQGRIWLDDVDCTGDEVLEDCSFNGWGVHNCVHSEDVGVICIPNQLADVLPPVENVTVTNTGSRTITIGWNSYDFSALRSIYRSKGFQIQYINTQGYLYTRRIYLYPYNYQPLYNTYTLRYLSFDEEYNISVCAYIQFNGCYGTMYGVYSDAVLGRTVVTAPTATPGQFHLIAINTTAIEAQWRHPPIDNRGGIIRGYKIFMQTTDDGSETLINLENNRTVYLIRGLQPATRYRFTLLAYTSAGDGPRTIQLAISTLNYDPVITQFGYYGNQLDKHSTYVFYYYQTNRVHIFCGTGNTTHAPADWYFSNGTRIGVRNRNFIVDYFPNGTAVLKIAETLPLNYCDGGIYTCIVNTTTHFEMRNFSLIINDSPPTPERPFIITAQSTRVTIGWAESYCHGGHPLSSFTIRYYDTSNVNYRYGYYYYRYDYNYQIIRDVSADIRNYTITGLQSDTQYGFQVRADSKYDTPSSFSLRVFITTLPPGPSSPRNVTAVLIAPLLVEVRWRTPAVPNGNIVQFTVYATPFSEKKARRIHTNFPGTANAGNITLVDHSVSYRFQVSASTMVDDVLNEGELSSFSIVFVPEPAIKPEVTIPSPIQNPSSEPHSNNNYGAEIGEIVGIAVGVIGVVVLSVIVIVVIVIKKRKLTLFKRFGHNKMDKVEYRCDNASCAESDREGGSMQ